MDAIATKVTELLLPSGLKALSDVSEEFAHFCQSKFIPFVSTNYNKLNISTSQLFRNEDYKLDELYEALYLVKHDSSSMHYINKAPIQLLKDEKKLIINDNAGMGKSTLLKMLFRYCVDAASHIPFYIDMKLIIKGESVLNIEDFILSTYPSFKDEISIDFIKSKLNTQKFIFLFDGADEIPDKMKASVYEKINNFVTKTPNCNHIIATRSEDIILSSFYDFVSYKISPLNKQQAYSLLRKYQFKDAPADELIDQIESDNNDSIKEFLSNPLLTTLLYTAYSHKRTIPLKKNLFFKQIYRSLYENHDATKIGYLTREKLSGLDIDSFEVVLSHLAFIGLREEKLEYTEKEILNVIKYIDDSHPTISFRPRSFLTDIVSRVPVFRKDGLVYRWQHKSIQEFFFVLYILSTRDDAKKKSIVGRIGSHENSQKFKLVLDILFDEDEEIFHDVLTRRIIEILDEESKHDKNDYYFCLNKFYKYVSCNIDVVFDQEFKEEVKSSENWHLMIRNELMEKLNLVGYYGSASNLIYGEKFNSRNIFSLPEKVILEVLYNKKFQYCECLESTHETDDAEDFEDGLATNVDSYATEEDFINSIEGYNFYYAEYSDLKLFIEDFDERKRKIDLDFVF